MSLYFRKLLWVCVIFWQSIGFGQNLVKNGDFATGTFENWTISNSANAAVLTGQGPDGSNAAQLSVVLTDITGSFSQNIPSLGAGQSYDLMFSMKGSSTGTDPFIVSLGNVNLYTATGINSPSYNQFTIQSINDTASPTLKFSIDGSSLNYTQLQIGNIVLTASGDGMESVKQVVNQKDVVTLTAGVTTVTVAGSVFPKTQEAGGRPPTPREVAYKIYKETLSLVEDVGKKVDERTAKQADMCDNPICSTSDGDYAIDPLYEKKDDIQKIVDNANAVNAIVSANQNDPYIQQIGEAMHVYGNWALGLQTNLAENSTHNSTEPNQLSADGLTGCAFQETAAQAPKISPIKSPSSVASFLVPSSIKILDQLQKMQLPKNSIDFTKKMVGSLQFRVDALGTHATEILRHIDIFAKDLRLELDQRSQRIDVLHSSLDIADLERTVEGLQVSLSGLGMDAIAQSDFRRTRRQLKDDLAFLFLNEKSLHNTEVYLQKVIGRCALFLQPNDIVDNFDEKNSQLVALSEVNADFLQNYVVEKKEKISSKYSKLVDAAYKKLGSVVKTFQKSLNTVKKLHEEVIGLREKIQEILPNLHHLVYDEIENIDQLYKVEGMLAANFEANVLLAGTDDVVRQASQGAASNPLNKSVNVWGRTFGQYIHQNGKGTGPSSHSGTGGVLIGADWKVKDCNIGFASAYSYSSLEIHQHNGNTEINLANLGPYVSYSIQDWTFNFSVMGGYVNTDSTRYVTGTNQKAKSAPHTWQLAPHVDIHYKDLLSSQSVSMSPYIMGDYAASWQSSFAEHGAQSANMSQDSTYSGFVRTEVGLEFSETIDINYGKLMLKEKSAWAYQRSFSPINTITLVGTTSAFVIPGSAGVQNLGLIDFSMTFIPKNQALPVVQVGYTGQFGSIYMSQVGSVNISKEF